LYLNPLIAVNLTEELVRFIFLMPSRQKQRRFLEKFLRGVKDELMLWRGRAACMKRRAAVTAVSTKNRGYFPSCLLGSEAKSVVQKEVRDRGGGAIASPARGALSPIPNHSCSRDR
jgi:hypothetical protein